MRALTLYGRADCHLCERLADVLAPIIAGRARLALVDIDKDPALVERYGLRVPVLVGEGHELSEFPLDVAAVERFLADIDG